MRLRARDLLLAAAALLAAPPVAALAAQEPGRIPIETYTLPNGLTVILSEDHSAQVVNVGVWYDVGSRDERPGRTGFAHLFEHMMFQGSANVKKGDYMSLIERAGGSLNGTTNEDRTWYFQTVPSNRLNLALWLEADRMRSLAVTPENFENQRQAVKEERRLRVDNQPYNRVFFEDMYGLVDSATCFPYAHSVIGSMADLDAAKTEDVQAFFAENYAPNNATIAIVGDFKPADARAFVTEYFGDIPRGAATPPVTCQQAFNTGARRKHIVNPLANLPAVAHAYRVPAYTDADTPALELLAAAMGQGESSRLTRRLTREARATAAAQALVNPMGPRQGPGTFLVFAVANQGVSPDSVDRLVAAEVARVAAEGIGEAELRKAKNGYRATQVQQRQSVDNVGAALLQANAIFGTPEAVNTDIERYMKVTVDDVKRVAAKYLVPQNSLIMIVTAEKTAS
ncbi:MAG TPA: pitrilysin family protein [Gemmatimonadaceae bacterium]|nr:pitrilysin family protein [Gemmatimonadaceae bacterium]